MQWVWVGAMSAIGGSATSESASDCIRARAAAIVISFQTDIPVGLHRVTVVQVHSIPSDISEQVYVDAKGCIYCQGDEYGRITAWTIRSVQTHGHRRGINYKIPLSIA
jgi:hypothetical protein